MSVIQEYLKLNLYKLLEPKDQVCWLSVFNNSFSIYFFIHTCIQYHFIHNTFGKHIYSICCI